MLKAFTNLFVLSLPANVYWRMHRCDAVIGLLLLALWLASGLFRCCLPDGCCVEVSCTWAGNKLLMVCVV